MDDTVYYWGHRSVAFIAIQDDGVVTLEFADVRALETGARVIHGQSPARAFRQLGHGVCLAQGHTAGKEGDPLSLITNVRPDTGLSDDEELGWAFADDPGTVDASDGNFSITGKVAADLSCELTARWHARFQPIFAQQNDAEAASS
ncbi:hypothetical protein LTR85_011789 [Meristemomyces frigidus]|nr:hypothetical protein LTR85_011789 [Meristemomyces frigidus]